MAITETAYAEAQMEIERLRTTLENLRRELDRAWREVDAMASERTQHARWRQELADDLGEAEKMRDALGSTLNKRENDLMMLRNAVDAMMAPLGYHGTISARDDRVQAVMDALAHVDTAPARQASAKQQLEAIRARDADDYAAADVLRNIRSAGNTDPELEATINMVADRRALLSAYDALAAENAALRKDAERYRHVWDDWPLTFGEMLQNGYGVYPIENKAQGDAAIDAAMEQSQ